MVGPLRGQRLNKKLKRSTRRTKEFERKLRASVGFLPFLEELARQPTSDRDCHRRFVEFLAFAARHRLRAKTLGELGMALVGYADSIPLDDEGSHVGEKPVAAFESKGIEATTDGVPRTPRFGKAIKSWMKNVPAQSRMPRAEVLAEDVAAPTTDGTSKEYAIEVAPFESEVAAVAGFHDVNVILGDSQAPRSGTRLP
jgi:hypothetical protein